MRYVDLGKTVEDHRKNVKEAAEKKSKGGVALFPLIIVVLLVVVGFAFSKNVRALFDPVSIVSSIDRPDLEETDGRTNVLLLGLDKRAASTTGESVLTDTLLFASIGRVEGNVAMISLPRDLWVKADGGKGPHFMKINSVYAVDGVEELLDITEDVLGMPIHYYAVVDFKLFRDTIDILGGVEVDVENTFDDFYFPIEGMENAPNIQDRYETVHFDSGIQVMDGETALKYVRSRKGSNGEGTDFARSKRQQKVIMAIKNKMLSLETLVDISKLKNLYDAYSANVDSNIGFEEVQSFYLLSRLIDFDSVRSIVLDDRSGANEGGLLYHPEDTSLFGGAYVLVPKSGDYSQLHAYVQRYIFGD